jgi:hypothetical protein
MSFSLGPGPLHFKGVLHMVTFTKRFLFAALASSLVLPVYAQDSMGPTVAVSAMLSAASEVPANASTGMGTLDASFDKDTHVLRYSVSCVGLTGPMQGWYCHSPVVWRAQFRVVQS